MQLSVHKELYGTVWQENFHIWKMYDKKLWSTWGGLEVQR